MELRDERPGDEPAISRLVTEAFRDAAHASGTEAAVIEGLRRAGALALSLVTVEGPLLLGHVAFSPVTVDGASGGWYGLGPLAVHASRRRRGIGETMVRAGLARLASENAAGCVVLGDPAYYSRFGFDVDPVLTLDGVPPEYFQSIRFRGNDAGQVAYHPAFHSDGNG